MGLSEPHLLCFPHGSPWVRTSKEIFSVLLLHSLSCFSSLLCLVFSTAPFNLFPQNCSYGHTNAIQYLLSLVCFKLISYCHLLSPFPTVTHLCPRGLRRKFLPSSIPPGKGGEKLTMCQSLPFPDMIDQKTGISRGGNSNWRAARTEAGFHILKDGKHLRCLLAKSNEDKGLKRRKDIAEASSGKIGKGSNLLRPEERWCLPMRGREKGMCRTLRERLHLSEEGGDGTCGVWEWGVECDEHLQSLEPLPSGGGGQGRRQLCLMVACDGNRGIPVKPVNAVLWFLTTSTSLFTHPLSHRRSPSFEWFS